MAGRTARTDFEKNDHKLASRVAMPRALTELLDDLPDHVAVVDDDGVIVSVNQQWRHFAEMNGMEASRVAEGASYLDAWRACDGASPQVRRFEELLRGTREQMEWEYACHSHRAKRWFLMRATRLQGGGVILVHTDITSRKLIEMRLLTEAHHDPLTGLLNRRGLERAWKKNPDRFGVGLMLDCDDFKSINDHLGHAAGDAVLRELATRFRASQQSGQRIARVGGDEFVWLLPDTDRRTGAEFAERLCRVVSERPMNYEGTPVPLTLSAAAARLSADVTSLGDLLVATQLKLRACKARSKAGSSQQLS